MCFLFDCGKTSKEMAQATSIILEFETQRSRAEQSLMEPLKTRVAQQTEISCRDLYI